MVQVATRRASKGPHDVPEVVRLAMIGATTQAKKQEPQLRCPLISGGDNQVPFFFSAYRKCPGKATQDPKRKTLQPSRRPTQEPKKTKKARAKKARAKKAKTARAKKAQKARKAKKS